MKPIFQAAKKAPKRIVFAEGEDERVLRAVQVVLDEELARPILIGRPAVLAKRIERYGLRIRARRGLRGDQPGVRPPLPRLLDRSTTGSRSARASRSPYAKIEMRRRQTLIGAMAIHRGDADGMLCGTFGTHGLHLHYIDQVLGLRQGVKNYAAMNAVMLPERTVFIADTYVNVDPTAEEIAEITLLAAEEMRRFGITPKVALLSHSSFGSSDHPQAKKMQQRAGAASTRSTPELEIEGEMHGDAALYEEVRLAAFPNSRLKGEANLLIMPTIDAANIAFNLLKVSGGGNVTLGPILLGVSRAGAHPHAVGDGAPDRQHDGADRRRRAVRAGSRASV